MWILLTIPGSPPPMRGKESTVDAARQTYGITPAYAGKSKSGEMTVSHSGDHPRLCGEKAREATSELLGQGSPPPMRGKESGAKAAWNERGITPAYAGKSVRQSRTCGSGQGSPPPMRGKD